MALLDCESIDEYSRYLEEHPEEYRQLIGAFFIKVTEFFRDPQLFDYLKEEVLPGLIEEAREEENQLRTGQPGAPPVRKLTRWRSWSPRYLAGRPASSTSGSLPRTSTRMP
jgi:hypothetical protein